MTEPRPAGGVLLTIEDVNAWRAEVATIEKQIERLIAKQDDLRRKLSAADLFLSDVKQGSPEHETGGKWTTAVREEIARHPNGVAVWELKKLIGDQGFADRLRENDKGFYSAINKLTGRGEIARLADRLFSPQNLKKFEEGVERGENEPIQADTNRRSPAAKVVLDFVKSRPDGVTSREMIQHLRSFPEFVTQIDRNSTHAYNIFTRLVRRGNLTKENGVYRHAFDANDEPTALKPGIFG